MRVLVIFIVAVWMTSPARAGETDQYYSWFVRVPDSTQIIDARINRGFQEALRQINARSPTRMSCEDVARRMLAEHRPASIWFPLGAMKDWRLRYRPSSATEREERHRPVSLYRYFPLLPIAFVMPLDPTVQADGVMFGTDKIGHLLTNSIRYWDVYAQARAEHMSVAEAVHKAIDLGVSQEAGIMGTAIGSTFSYADLESNYQGLELIRSWCERGELSLEDGLWKLKVDFSIARWVNPCWDESFYPNAYAGLTADGVQLALAGYCSVLRRPDIVERRRAYRQRGCHSESVHHLDALIARGVVPDPAPFTIERACGEPPAR